MHLLRSQHKSPCRRVKPITNEKIKLCFWLREGNSNCNAIVARIGPNPPVAILSRRRGSRGTANFEPCLTHINSSFLPGWIGQFVSETPSCREFSLCYTAFRQHNNHKHVSSLSLTLFNNSLFIQNPDISFHEMQREACHFQVIISESTQTCIHT